MKKALKTTLAVAAVAVATPASAQITLYEHDGFQGQYFTTDRPIGNFQSYGFNDRASSAMVHGDRWEVCNDSRYRGRCVVLRPGRYPSLSAMGLNDRVSSTRPVPAGARFDDDRYGPAPVADYSYPRSGDERLFEATVISVRAVLGPPEQRCWVEREQVPRERSHANVPAALAGAVIGGILGHQIGGGRGQDLATVGGAVAGAAVGSNVGRGEGDPETTDRDVQRCADVPGQARPSYWDVIYRFRGQDHHVQMTAPPGATIRVNEHGEPRN